eukprot:TRINITY_DN209_c0_g1_i2.p1 TRINITY_DN209_c0_g1~~TRINITY_DN209_c0_g1_i2.p1  ORF type:complete len:120 (+),score=50.08 TRINITY_DN209_c0_g1_i2:74-433(+)
MSAPAYCNSSQLTDGDREHLENQICLFVKRDHGKAGLPPPLDHKRITLGMNAETVKLGGKDGLKLAVTGSLPVAAGLSGTGEAFEMGFSCQKKGTDIWDWEMRLDSFTKVDAGFAGEKM